jgi:hypothetical protein
MFFEMLRGVYGAAKCEAQWPTEEDRQAAIALWQVEIDKHTPEELRAAINNAIRMASNMEKDWQWPNIGLILSGAKRYSCAAHRPFLPPPEINIPPPSEREYILRKMREELGI